MCPAVGYLCHPLSVLSNLLVVGSSCQGCLFFLHFGVSTSHTLSSLVLVNFYCPCLFILILYHLQFMPISLVACEKFLLPFCSPLISLFSCFFPILNYVELLWNPSVDISCSRLFMSYFVGSFQSIGVWQQLSMLSLLSCFLSFGLSTSDNLSSPVLVKLYFMCLFMLIVYGLQLIPILLVPCTVLSGDDSFP